MRTARFAPPSLPQPQQGFVLPVVLVLLALMMSVAIGVVWMLDQQRTSVALQRKQLQAQQDMQATEATLKYLLATRPFNNGGLAANVFSPTPLYQDDLNAKETLLLDGRWYQGVGQTRFSLQDQSGLAPLNYSNDELKLLDKLLASEGIAINERQHLMDTLNDYIDADDLKRLNGAESSDYRRAGLPPPANRSLQLPQELANVLDWQKYHLSKSAFLDKVAILRGGSWLNLNTSPVDVLRLHPSISQEVAQKIVDGRPWSSITTLNKSLKTNFPDANGESFFYTPGFVIRIRVQHPDYPLMRDQLIVLKRNHNLTPDKLVVDPNTPAPNLFDLSPWRIMYVLDYPVDRTAALPPVSKTGVELFSPPNLPATTGHTTKP